jgi:predicted RNase H-like nuclease (RuvC/YqgF family)
MIYSNSFNLADTPINIDNNKEELIFKLQERNKKLYDNIKQKKKIIKKLQDDIEYLVNNFQTK